MLLDTSAALARVDREHVFHRAVEQATRAAGPLGLSGHAGFETYSVLTRLAPPKRLSPTSARRLIEVEFPATVHLSAGGAAELAAELAARQVAGGSVYDALVAAAAREAGLVLLTCDERAVRTYRALSVDFVLAGR